MRPIPSPMSKDALFLLNKAQQLLEKAEKLEMVEHDGKKVPAFAADGAGKKDLKEAADNECPECKGKGDDCKCNKMAKAKCDCGKEPCECKSCPKCGGKMEKAGCMKMGCGGKMEKAEKCPSCGGKMEKGGCMKMGCNKMKKSAEAGAQPGFTTSFDSNPSGVMFLAESGGQTRSAYYTTNQYPYNAENVTNKGSISESFNMESISGKMNPHDGGGVDRQVENGVLSKAKAALLEAHNIAKGMCGKCGANQFSGCKLGFGSNCRGLLS